MSVQAGTCRYIQTCAYTHVYRNIVHTYIMCIFVYTVCVCLNVSSCTCSMHKPNLKHSLQCNLTCFQPRPDQRLGICLACPNCTSDLLPDAAEACMNLDIEN